MTDALTIVAALLRDSGLRDDEADEFGATILSAIAALPLADRLAYARGLVADAGWIVARVPDAAPPSLIAPLGLEFLHVAGFNACRAAVLASAKETGDAFPKPRRNDGGKPCGECHLKPGEICDICGAKETGDV